MTALVRLIVVLAAVVAHLQIGKAIAATLWRRLRSVGPKGMVSRDGREQGSGPR
jgi:hypothetical protein